MATFVLVHGAWQSAGTWNLLLPLLSQQGHQVLCPALQGLGTGNKNLTADISLRTHVEGIAGFVAQRSSPVVLVGHSYAGMIITAVAAAHPEQIRHVVYLDAFIPENGQSVVDLLPASIVERFRQTAAQNGGWRLPGGDAQLDLWGLRPGPARDFVRASLCDFTLRCFEEPIQLPAQTPRLPTTYVACTANDYPARPFFAPFAAKARRLGFAVHDVDTGHDCHAEQPEAIALILAATLQP